MKQDFGSKRRQMAQRSSDSGLALQIPNDTIACIRGQANTTAVSESRSSCAPVNVAQALWHYVCILRLIADFFWLMRANWFWRCQHNPFSSTGAYKQLWDGIFLCFRVERPVNIRRLCKGYVCLPARVLLCRFKTTRVYADSNDKVDHTRSVLHSDGAVSRCTAAVMLDSIPTCTRDVGNLIPTGSDRVCIPVYQMQIAVRSKPVELLWAPLMLGSTTW